MNNSNKTVDNQCRKEYRYSIKIYSYRTSITSDRPSIFVLLPAHNETGHIQKTIEEADDFRFVSIGFLKGKKG